jgi:hypothetical protein
MNEIGQEYCENVCSLPPALEEEKRATMDSHSWSDDGKLPMTMQ